ncbi:hypothetical protein MIR68_001418 [Amoeboaphelidium protococcarum]|nr:hypothetical protein MIR68_001418 [Amoeboaphelidium protococcarum]
MYKFHRNITLSRLDTFKSEQRYADVNLYSCLVKKRSSEYLKIESYTVPELKRITFKEALLGQYELARVGDKFGPSWATVWFRVQVSIPKGFVEVDDEKIWLRWNSNSEAMIWSQDGKCLQGLNGGSGHDKRLDFALDNKLLGNSDGGHIVLYVEMACNGMFGNASGGDSIQPPKSDRQFTLDTAELVVYDQVALGLWYDYQIISDMAKELPSDSQLAAEALVTANSIANTFLAEDKQTWSQARQIAQKFLSAQAGPADHEITAVGMCHIDSCWLWMWDETRRKCARSWASQLVLMDKYPDYKFAVSQACQLESVMNDYPELFERLKEKAKSGQFIPVGATWVEMDGNLPSGESFCRQFLYGQRFFKEHFGQYCDIFWLPDTFGYSAQLPQIMKLSGADYFLTQKLSWNNINKFPHTTFWWKGLDGSKVLTHFPPADTYCGQGTVKEVMYNVKNHKDKEHSNQSMYLFGHGDGGNGATYDMLERLERMKGGVKGLPKVKMGSPQDFFKNLNEADSESYLTWSSELYFELHRGTYTSQAFVKWYNRKCEFLLRDIEQLYVLLGNGQYPRDQLDAMWKKLLFNQFHDILPGTSIELVYEDTRRDYKEIYSLGTKLRSDAFNQMIYNAVSSGLSGDKMEQIKSVLGIQKESSYEMVQNCQMQVAVYNSLQFDRAEVVEIDIPSDLAVEPSFEQVVAAGNSALVLAKTPGFSLSFNSIKDNDIKEQVTISFDGDVCLMSNSLIDVKFSCHGLLLSLVDKRANGREVIDQQHCGNKFVLHQDLPLYWDNWDLEAYHLEKTYETGIGQLQIIENGPLRVAFTVAHPLTGKSQLKQKVSLTCNSARIDFDTEVEWHESHKVLKVQFPVNVKCDHATYDVPFGHLTRPTHFNTSVDFAKFEVCGHKYSDLSEYGYGVALLSDSKYGYSTRDNVLRMTLLRAPKAPDGNCDMGHHKFKYALYPHLGSFTESDVVQESYKLNVPLLTRLVPVMKSLPSSVQSAFTISCSNVIIDTVKLPEESQDIGDANSIIVRLHEVMGGRGQYEFKSRVKFTAAQKVNILEGRIEDIAVTTLGVLSVSINPFEIVTLKLHY